MPYVATCQSRNENERRAFLRSLLAGGAALASGRLHATDLAAEERAAAAQRAALCSPANAVGVGLQGRYYDRAGLEGAIALTRVDPVVDFDATLDSPPGRVLRSAAWSGWVRPSLSGRYRFHFEQPGASVTVANMRLVNDGNTADAIDLDAGRYYPVSLRLPLLPANVQSRVTLQWTAPHGARYVVPRALLHLPSDAVGGKA